MHKLDGWFGGGKGEVKGGGLVAVCKLIITSYSIQAEWAVELGRHFAVHHYLDYFLLWTICDLVLGFLFCR
jgi:hypothetical protein